MRKLIGMIAVAAIALCGGLYLTSNVSVSNGLALSNVEALAASEVNPNCPNGCLENGTGCFCHFWFPTHKEARWK